MLLDVNSRKKIKKKTTKGTGLEHTVSIMSWLGTLIGLRMVSFVHTNFHKCIFYYFYFPSYKNISFYFILINLIKNQKKNLSYCLNDKLLIIIVTAKKRAQFQKRKRKEKPSVWQC